MTEIAQRRGRLVVQVLSLPRCACCGGTVSHVDVMCCLLLLHGVWLKVLIRVSMFFPHSVHVAFVLWLVVLPMMRTVWLRSLARVSYLADKRLF